MNGQTRLEGGAAATEPRAGNPRPTSPISGTTIRLSRIGILVVAPAVIMATHAYHPWIGNPGEPGFHVRLAAAVEADALRWAIAHLGVAVGAGLLVLAFLAIRSYLREAGEERWSALGLPFIVMGSVFYAMLPAMEFAPLAAVAAGADAAAIQAALTSWFIPILLIGGILFLLGVAGFAAGIARSGVLSPAHTWIVVVALVVMAATRLFPVGAAQLYVGPAAAVVALWTLAYALRGRPPRLRAAGEPGALHTV